MGRDDDVAGRVTVRHLLTHTSGIDGDVFVDTGRGDDCVARYVDLLAEADLVHEPGATYSYCNSGFVLLGRIIEVLDGGTWDASLRRRIAEPLGLDDVCTLPEEALLRRAAVGHERGAPVTRWMLPRSVGPAGLVTTTASDLLGFARAWLTADPPAHLARMAEPLVAVPDGSDVEAVGWGWRVGRWQGHTVLGHSGQTLGQSATLRVVPSLGLAVCVLTNADEADAVHAAVVPAVVRDLTGVDVPSPLGPDPDAAPADLTRHTGTYTRRAARYDVEHVDDELWLTATPAGELAEHGAGAERFRLHPRDASGDAFVRRSSETAALVDGHLHRAGRRHAHPVRPGPDGGQALMRILDLSSAPRRPVEAHASVGFSIAAIGITAETHLVAVSLRPGGVIGRHPAAGRQLLVVLTGDAVVSGSDGEAVAIGPGQAAVWEPGEPHETRSVTGVSALVVEGDLDLGAPGHHVDPGDISI